MDPLFYNALETLKGMHGELRVILLSRTYSVLLVPFIIKIMPIV